MNVYATNSFRKLQTFPMLPQNWKQNYTSYVHESPQLRAITSQGLEEKDKKEQEGEGIRWGREPRRARSKVANSSLYISFPVPSLLNQIFVLHTRPHSPSCPLSPLELPVGHLCSQGPARETTLGTRMPAEKAGAARNNRLYIYNNNTLTLPILVNRLFTSST